MHFSRPIDAPGAWRRCARLAIAMVVCALALSTTAAAEALRGSGTYPGPSSADSVLGSRGESATIDSEPSESAPRTLGPPAGQLGARCSTCGESHGEWMPCALWPPGEMLGCLRQSIWPPPGLRHSSNSGRSVGRGEPLGGTSWLNRPYHVGWFAGTLWGDAPLGGSVDQHNTFFGGYQVGLDFDHFWGGQARFGFASPRLQNLTQPQVGRNGRLSLFDVDLLYYPWGDSRIRPYVLAGLGLTRVDIRNEQGVRQIDSLFSVPFGLGVKHHFRRWLSVRLELVDNLAIAGSGLATMHNISLTTGVEVHLGVQPKSYWPWNPSRHIW